MIEGIVIKATTEKSRDGLKDIFKFGIRRDDGEKDLELSLFDPHLIAETILLKNKHVTINVEPDKNPKFLKLVGIKESEAPKQAQPQLNAAQQAVAILSQPQQTRENSIETQVAVKAIIELITHDMADITSPDMAKLVHDTLAWCRVRIPSSVATNLLAARKQAPEGMFPKGDSSPTVAQSTAKADFVEACTKAGYSVQTKQGQAGIRAWLLKAGKTNLPFDELSEDKQAELIHMMRCQELEP